jgi:hypothetical protein
VRRATAVDTADGFPLDSTVPSSTNVKEESRKLDSEVSADVHSDPEKRESLMYNPFTSGVEPNKSPENPVDTISTLVNENYVTKL